MDKLVWLANDGGACNLVTEAQADYQINGNGNVVTDEQWPNEAGFRIVSDAEAAELLGSTEDKARAAREGDEPAGDEPEDNEPEGDGLEELKAPQLDKLAADESIDLAGVRSNADKVAAIRAAREAKASEEPAPGEPAGDNDGQ